MAHCQSCPLKNRTPASGNTESCSHRSRGSNVQSSSNVAGQRTSGRLQGGGPWLRSRTTTFFPPRPNSSARTSPPIPPPTIRKSVAIAALYSNPLRLALYGLNVRMRSLSPILQGAVAGDLVAGAGCMSVLDWVSGRVFKFVHGNNLVYNTCWEDPRLDRVALQIQTTDNILVITSAGCNALDYALCGPNHVHAVDMNPRQNALLDLKI